MRKINRGYSSHRTETAAENDGVVIHSSHRVLTAYDHLVCRGSDFLYIRNLCWDVYDLCSSLQFSENSLRSEAAVCEDECLVPLHTFLQTGPVKWTRFWYDKAIMVQVVLRWQIGLARSIMQTAQPFCLFLLQTPQPPERSDVSFCPRTCQWESGFAKPL